MESDRDSGGLLAGVEEDAWASESTALVAGFGVLSLCVDKFIVSTRLKRRNGLLHPKVCRPVTMVKLPQLAGGVNYSVKKLAEPVSPAEFCIIENRKLRCSGGRVKGGRRSRMRRPVGAHARGRGG